MFFIIIIYFIISSSILLSPLNSVSVEFHPYEISHCDLLPL